MSYYDDSDQDNWVGQLDGVRFDWGRAMGQFALVAGTMLLIQWCFRGNKATVWGLIRLVVGLGVVGCVIYFFGLVVFYMLNPDAS